MPKRVWKWVKRKFKKKTHEEKFEDHVKKQIKIFNSSKVYLQQKHALRDLFASKSEKAVPVFVKAINHVDKAIQQDGIRYLGLRGSAKELPALFNALNDEKHSIHTYQMHANTIVQHLLLHFLFHHQE